jgi:hypothetical protein
MFEGMDTGHSFPVGRAGLAASAAQTGTWPLNASRWTQRLFHIPAQRFAPCEDAGHHHHVLGAQVHSWTIAPDSLRPGGVYV